MSKYKLFIYYLVIGFLSSGCSSLGGNSGLDERAEADLNYAGSDCILIPTVRDYTPLDRQHLLIRGAAKRAYFVTLSRPTFEMRGSISLRFDSRDDQLCPFGGDSIVFGSFGDDRIRVRSISRVTSEQEEQLLIRYGKREPAESKTPVAPEQVKGAEVEELG